MRYWLTLLILLFAVSVVGAEEHNAKYSCQNYMGGKAAFLKKEPIKELQKGIIVGTCFYQPERPNSDIFPAGMTGVTFKNCNLDNVLVPIGNTIIGGCHRQIKAQNDWSDWILDDVTLAPKELIPGEKARRLKAGLSIDPKDIPVKQLTEVERETLDDTLNAADLTD